MQVRTWGGPPILLMMRAGPPQARARAGPVGRRQCEFVVGGPLFLAACMHPWGGDPSLEESNPVAPGDRNDERGAGARAPANRAAHAMTNQQCPWHCGCHVLFFGVQSSIVLF